MRLGNTHRELKDWKEFDSNNTAKEFWNKADANAIKGKFYLNMYREAITV